MKRIGNFVITQLTLGQGRALMDLIDTDGLTEAEAQRRNKQFRDALIDGSVFYCPEGAEAHTPIADANCFGEFMASAAEIMTAAMEINGFRGANS